MRIVAITRILNESDIVEAFVRHSAHYVQHHIFLDNGSNDGTLEILKSLLLEGFPITVLQNEAVSFSERKFNTLLYHKAVSEFGADWVLTLDADEFLDDRLLGRSFPEHLASVQSAISCVKVKLVNYYVRESDNPQELIVPVRMTGRIKETEVYKVFVRGNLVNRQVSVEPGGHGVLIDGGSICPWYFDPEVVLAHFPQRSPYQFLSKNVIGWAKILAAGEAELQSRSSIHYQGPFHWLKSSPQSFLRDAEFLSGRWTRGDLTQDPIAYRGSDLKYTEQTDYAMRAVRVMMCYLESLASRHGALIDAVPGVREFCEARHSVIEQIL